MNNGKDSNPCFGDDPLWKIWTDFTSFSPAQWLKNVERLDECFGVSKKFTKSGAGDKDNSIWDNIRYYRNITPN